MALLIIGAILALAVRKEMPAIDIQTVGVILMIAGVGLLLHARRGSRTEREVTRVEDPEDPDLPTRTVRESHVEREVE